GWNHRRCDMSGSRFYDSPSTSEAKTDLELDWSAEGNGPLLTGDVTGDGNLEVITYNGHSIVMIYDSEGNLLRQITNAEYTGSNRAFSPSLIADYDGDGIKDIGIGTSSRNYVNLPQSRSFFYNSDGTQLAQFDCDQADNKDSWMFPIAVLENKVFTQQGMGYDRTPRGLVAYDQASTNLLWHYKVGREYNFNLAYDGSALKIVTGGVTVHNGGTGCGVDGSATCTTDGDMYTIAIDSNGNEIFTQNYSGNGNPNGYVDSCFVDIDQDGDLEVLSFEGHNNYYHGTGQIHIQSGTTGAYLDTFNAPYDTMWRNYAFGDLDNDGRIEIAATSSAPGGYTQYLLDQNLNVIASSNMSGEIHCASDINGSGQADLLMADGDTLRITDLQFNEWYSWDAGSKISSIIVSDLDGDSVNEIILVTTNNNLQVLKSEKIGGNDPDIDPHNSSIWKTQIAPALLIYANASGAVTLGQSIVAIIGVFFPEPTTSAIGGTLAFKQIFGLASSVWLEKQVADPPDPNYDEIYLPQVPTISIEGLGVLSPEHAAILQRSVNLRAKFVAYLKALLVTMEREAGAREANDETWLEAQQNAFVQYSKVVQSLIAEISSVEQDSNSVLVELGISSLSVELSDVVDFQQYLINHGLPEDELYILSLFGIEPNDVQEQIDAWIAIDPCELIGATVQDVFSDAEMFRQFLSVFPEPNNYAPIALAGKDQTVEQSSYAGALVTLDGSSSSDLDGDPLTYEWTWGSGLAVGINPVVTLPLGLTTVTLTVSDGQLSDSDIVDINVVDTTPPDFTLSVTPAILWPPNHKMVEITPNWTVSDNCDESVEVTLISITMNEGDETNSYDPSYDDTEGDGHTADDIQVDSDGSIYLRAERSGKGNGRVYTITYRAVDNSGNYVDQSATVTVPHDQQ
ncbi:hypothetical protein LCGC14_1450320, partial [marine sediment metagenome]